MSQIRELINKLSCNRDVTIIENDLPYIFIYQNDSCDIKLFNRDYLNMIRNNKNTLLTNLFVGLCKPIDSSNLDKIIELLFTGMMIIYEKKRRSFYFLDIISRQSRSPSDSISEPDSLVGSRDGFVENAKINLSLLRSRIKDDKLEIEEFSVGRRSKTKVMMLSISDITNDDFIKEIKEKIDKIDIDALTTIEDITTCFQENKLMPQYLYLGSPDIASRHLYNGEILLIIDTIPNVVCLPNTIESFVKFRFEHSNMKLYSYIERAFLICSLITSTFLIGILSSFLTFQSDSLSLLLLSTLKVTQKGVFIPIYLEILLILFLFEMYYIVSFKSPKITLSSMVVLVGGIIIGQNTIESGMVGVVIITIVALAFLSTFTISSNFTFITSLSLMRFIILASSAVFGIFGMTIASFYLLARITDESSFNTSYLFPFIPLDIEGIQKYSLFESSKRLVSRPYEMNTKNRRKKR